MVNVPFSEEFGSGDPPRYTPGGRGFVLEPDLVRHPELTVPEVNSGFTPAWWYTGAELTALRSHGGVFAVPGRDALPEDLAGRALVLWYKAETGPGRFGITATLTAQEDCGEALAFVSRRRLAWRGTLKAGETVQIQILCDVSPIIGVGGGDAAQGDLGRVEDLSLDLAVIGAGLRDLTVEPWEGPALFIMGDSTVTDQPAQTPYAPGVNYCGWGQVMPLYAGTSFVVSNHAHSGLSTETFRDLGHYDVMRPQVRPGDTVLIQFGHNDQKHRHLSADTGYTDNLVRYIRELRDLGAAPVLVTPLARNTWRTETAYNDLLRDHAAAMLRVAERENVPAVDLHRRMMEALLAAGLDRAKNWYHPGDYAHPNDFGAHMSAGFVAEGLVKLGILPPYDVSPWPVHAPLTPPERPDPDNWHGNTPPAQEKKLTDYGLIADYPWPIV